ncbi:MAG: hypothetical protein VW715_02410 [Rhodospirillales bacterium]
MGFAAGMRAGQSAVENSIALYQEAKKNRQMREIEAGIEARQKENAERQFGIDRDSVQTGLTAEQQRNMVMPQAPSATGLSPQEQAAMVGMGTSYQTTPVGLTNEQRAAVGLPPAASGVMTGATGLSQEQMARMVQEPSRSGSAMRPGGEYTPISDSAIERMRANELRKLGYTEEADAALNRSLQFDAIAEERRRYGIDQEYRERAEGRDIRELELKEAREALQNKLTNQQVNLNDFKLTQIEDMNAAHDAFAAHTGDFGSFMQTDAWSKLGQRERNALVEGETGLATNLQNLSTLTIERELSKATDLKSTVAAANRLSATDGVDIRFTVDDKTGEVTLSSVYNDNTADNYMQEQGKPIKFNTEQEAIRHIGEMAKDPIMAADNFITRQKEAATVVAAARQKGIENINQFIETRASVIEAMIGDFETYAGLDEADKLVFDAKVAEIMSPLMVSLGVGGEQMGGLANPSSNLTTGSPPSVEDVVPSVDDIIQDAANRPRTAAGLTATETPATRQMTPTASQSPRFLSNDVRERREAAAQAYRDLVAVDEDQLAYALRGGRGTSLGK